MPKPKQFLKDNKKKSSKAASQAPQNADEYLAAGVDFEEAGEKWRGGDAAKSTRFFIRAIDLYEEALKKFPNSFDLAYNKARVQYELTQHPKLTAQLPGTLLELLRTALDSSRVALILNQDNADALFNTAQCLTSLSEALQDDRSGGPREDSLKLLEEALELFQRCLTLQEYNFSESQAESQSAPEDDAEDMLDTEDSGVSMTDSQPPQDDRWASIVEPVTNDTLLDTVLAQLETLTTLCGLVTGNEGRGLVWIEEYSTDLINQKMPAYVQGTDREDEAALTRANFIAALADSNFRSQRIAGPTYELALSDAYAPLDIAQDPEGLCDKAEALLAYNSSLRLSYVDAERQKAHNISRWKALTAALESLTSATKIPSADNLPKIHMTRGDVEILRYQLGQAPSLYEPAAKNGATLLKNAVTFYKGAASLAQASGLQKEAQEGAIKIALGTSLAGQGEELKDLVKLRPGVCERVLEEAIEEGLITLEWLAGQGFSIA